MSGFKQKRDEYKKDAKKSLKDSKLRGVISKQRQPKNRKPGSLPKGNRRPTVALFVMNAAQTERVVRELPGLDNGKCNEYVSLFQRMVESTHCKTGATSKGKHLDGQIKHLVKKFSSDKVLNKDSAEDGIKKR